MMTTLTDAAILAHDHYGPWADGGGPGPFFLLFPLFWIAVFATLFFVFRGRRRAFWQNHSAEHTLRERYAKGEIAEEEYQMRLRTLRGK